MDKLRNEIKEKLIAGRGNYIHPKYQTLKQQVFQHLDQKI